MVPVNVDRQYDRQWSTVVDSGRQWSTVVDSKLILLSYCHVDILSTVGRQCRQLIDSVDSVDSQGRALDTDLSTFAYHTPRGSEASAECPGAARAANWISTVHRLICSPLPSSQRGPTPEVSGLEAGQAQETADHSP